MYPILNFLWTAEIEALLDSITKLTASSYSSSVSSDDNVSSADVVDQASSYTDKTVEMRALNRSRKLLEKIDSALKRLKDGTYGFCEETSEPIGLKRLIARPIATLSIEAQEKHERNEKIYVED